jgi:hypothetical protein
MREDFMNFFKGCPLRKLICAIFFLLAMALRAHADAALLLEEPFGHFGAFNPTGHAAIYLDHVCAASLTELRLCAPDEPGVVISRYHHIGGYDWIAIPLIPYLYAVEDPDDVPHSINRRLERRLRNQYREKHLLNMVPDDPKHEVPGGEWTQLIGAAYERKIYGYQVETTEQQDRALIEALNQRSNKSHFNLFFNNCANFAEEILNFYYPHSVHRNFIADAGLMTPKQAARSLVHYSKHHRDLQFTTFLIPQVKGPIHRSGSVDGIIESLVKSKKYVVPIAALHPFVAGGLAAVYLVDGRFHPDAKAQIFDPSKEFEPGDVAEAKLPKTQTGDGSMSAQTVSLDSEMPATHEP